MNTATLRLARLLNPFLDDETCQDLFLEMLEDSTTIYQDLKRVLEAQGRRVHPLVPAHAPLGLLLNWVEEHLELPDVVALLERFDSHDVDALLRSSSLLGNFDVLESAWHHAGAEVRMAIMASTSARPLPVHWSHWAARNLTLDQAEDLVERMVEADSDLLPSLALAVKDCEVVSEIAEGNFHGSDDVVVAAQFEIDAMLRKADATRFEKILLTRRPRRRDWWSAQGASIGALRGSISTPNEALARLLPGGVAMRLDAATINALRDQIATGEEQSSSLLSLVLLERDQLLGDLLRSERFGARSALELLALDGYSDELFERILEKFDAAGRFELLSACIRALQDDDPWREPPSTRICAVQVIEALMSQEGVLMNLVEEMGSWAQWQVRQWSSTLAGMGVFHAANLLVVPVSLLGTEGAAALRPKVCALVAELTPQEKGTFEVLLPDFAGTLGELLGSVCTLS